METKVTISEAVGLTGVSETEFHYAVLFYFLDVITVHAK